LFDALEMTDDQRDRAVRAARNSAA
jgi:hypothetical protein